MTDIVVKEATELDFSREKFASFRKKVAAKASDVEWELFVEECIYRRLHPGLNQIYWMKVQDKPTIITSINGYRLIAQRTSLYVGSDAGLFEQDSNGKPLSCSVTVHKLVQGMPCPFTGKALLSDHQRDVRIWREMPFTMLEKCAEAKALRKAFPEELGGIYTEDEVHSSEPGGHQQRSASLPAAFSGKDGRHVAWLHRTLEAKGVPRVQWAAIAEQVDGLGGSDFKARFEAAVQQFLGSP